MAMLQQALMATRGPSGYTELSPLMVVAITGATGFIGSRLVDRLVTDGHEVRILTRSESKAHEKFPVKKYPDLKVGGESKWAELIKGTTGVVNLAGPPISTRWTPEVKTDINNCRVVVTGKAGGNQFRVLTEKNVVQAINSAPKEEQPAVLVSSTAVGFYGKSTFS